MRKKSGSEVFGELLRNSRKKNKLTGEKLAQLSGIDRTHISKIEHGVHAADFLVVKRIAEALKEPSLIRVFLLQNFPKIDDYYRKINGPSTLGKTIATDFAKGLTAEDVVNSLSKEFGSSPEHERKFLNLVRNYHKIYQEIETFAHALVKRKLPKE